MCRNDPSPFLWAKKFRPTGAPPPPPSANPTDETHLQQN